MDSNYTFSIDLRVFDLPTLYRAARARLVAEGNTEEQAEALLRPYQDDIDTEACLIALLDPGALPGCDIQGSQADRIDLGTGN